MPPPPVPYDPYRQQQYSTYGRSLPPSLPESERYSAYSGQGYGSGPSQPQHHHYAPGPGPGYVSQARTETRPTQHPPSVPWPQEHPAYQHSQQHRLQSSRSAQHLPSIRTEPGPSSPSYPPVTYHAQSARPEFTHRPLSSSHSSNSMRSLTTSSASPLFSRDPFSPHRAAPHDLPGRLPGLADMSPPKHDSRHALPPISVPSYRGSSGAGSAQSSQSAKSGKRGDSQGALSQSSSTTTPGGTKPPNRMGLGHLLD